MSQNLINIYSAALFCYDSCEVLKQEGDHSSSETLYKEVRIGYKVGLNNSMATFNLGYINKGQIIKPEHLNYHFFTSSKQTNFPSTVFAFPSSTLWS